MRAVVSTAYGDADVLRLSDMDQPAIGPKEVLVRVAAAGVDRGVWHLMTGRPLLVRAALGLRRPRVPVRGRELAGVVAAVGARVTRLRPGDEVYGTSAWGSFAEYARAAEAKLARRPANVPVEQAAATPVSGVTALQAVRRAGVAPGHRVLAVGATGGVGSFVGQLAKARGASVTAVCSPSTVEFARQLGADDVLDYTREEVDRDGPVYDAVIDMGGNRRLAVLRRALAKRGILVIVGGEQGRGVLLGGFGRQFVAPLAGPRRRVGLTAVERAADLDDLRELIESGAVTPAVDRTYPLEQASQALRHLAEGHPRGKLVLTV